MNLKPQKRMAAEILKVNPRTLYRFEKKGKSPLDV